MPPHMVYSPPKVQKYTTRAGDGPDPNDPPSYRHDVRGIMVGYSGHVPRTRSKVGGTAFGGVVQPPGSPLQEETHQGNFPPRPCDRPPLPGEICLMSKDVEARHVNQLHDYRGRVQGIMPGYSGFKPGANSTYGGSVFGGMKQFNDKDAGAMFRGVTAGTVSLMEHDKKGSHNDHSALQGRTGDLLGLAEKAINERFGNMHACFKHIDNDRSGRIAIEEFGHHMSMWNIPVDKTELAEMFKEVDTDNSGTVDYLEFCQALQRDKNIGARDNTHTYDAMKQGEAQQAFSAGFLQNSATATHFEMEKDGTGLRSYNEYMLDHLDGRFA